ncbi:MAG: hypothetical protein QW231_02480 [Candidatus Bathyarchaeia archaeon]
MVGWGTIMHHNQWLIHEVYGYEWLFRNSSAPIRGPTNPEGKR